MKNQKFYLVILLIFVMLLISIAEIWGSSSDSSAQAKVTYRAGKKDDPTAVKFICSCPVLTGDCYCRSSQETK